MQCGGMDMPPCAQPYYLIRRKSNLEEDLTNLFCFGVNAFDLISLAINKMWFYQTKLKILLETDFLKMN